MKKLYSIFIVLLCFASCTNNGSELRQIKPDVGASRDYILEDIATDIKIIELEDSVMIGGVQIIKSYRDLLFIYDVYQNQILIYKNNGEFVALLNKIGKGPNEYINIGTFSFDENNNILSIHARSTTEIIRYKVPSIEFIDRFKSNGYINALENLGDNSFFCTKESDSGGSGSINMLDISNNVYTKLPIETSYLSEELSPDNVVTRLNSDELLFCNVSGRNTVYKINNDGGVAPLFDIDFGSYSIADEYWESTAEDDVDLGESLADGSFAIMPQFIIDDTVATSFWYIASAASGESMHPGMQLYYENKTDGSVINASNIYLKDTELAIQPIGLSDGYYLALIDREDILNNSNNSILNKINSTSGKGNPVLMKFKLN